MTAAARLSVIVLADRYATIRRVVEHLGRQTVAGDVELVVACPFRNGFELPPGPFQVASVRLVETPLLPLGPALGKLPDGLWMLARRGTVRRGDPRPAHLQRLLEARGSARCGDRLPELLEPGMPLDAELASRGGRFLHARGARVAHLNVAGPVPWTAERFHGGPLLRTAKSTLAARSSSPRSRSPGW